MVVLDHQNTEKSEKLKLYRKLNFLLISIIGKKEIFHHTQKDRKKFEQNNETIALNILFAPHNAEKIKLAYKSKHNFQRENQVILSMISDGKKQHYLTLKSFRENSLKTSAMIYAYRVFALKML